MQRFFATVLIAAALASPLGAEVASIECAWPDGELATFQLDLEKETVSDTSSQGDWSTTILIWNNRFIGWADVQGPRYGSNTIKSFLLDRQFLSLQTRVMSTGFRDLSSLDTTLQCIRS